MTDQNSAVLFSDDQTLKHAPIIASRSARHSFFLQACGDPKGPIAAVSRLPPVSGSFQQLRDGVLPCRCHGVSRFEGPHCPPLCCPRVCLNGAFDVQSRVSQRPRPGPEQRSAGHGSHTWQAVSETRMSVVDESRVPFLTRYITVSDRQQVNATQAVIFSFSESNDVLKTFDSVGFPDIDIMIFK
ncbi:hypothetical protein ROHU_021110 [Labeo rohita]|uniref:Uncharacterized protein n=1 Tax=Labeo rohita TaxID=84645 RepID=A0A498N6H0_LABRO|nr:hypothetical protein ROHU_021110 [Labeo rohita]